MDTKTWLSIEIANVEAALQGLGPTCQLDRQHASPPSLKETEGRYFILRRATRLMERGESFVELVAEANKARALLAAGEGVARDPKWAAYFKGVLRAVEDLQQRAGEPLDDPVPPVAL
ncbi:MAG: hypothetical protein Q7U13_02935 [Rhodoferax sp.]|nr:hypothetical protein [Rhodoferax sp.]